MRNMIAITGLFAVLAGSPVAANVLDECRQDYWPDVRLRACGEIIDNWNFGPGEKALAYNNRGVARTEAGALGQAIADFTASIQLDRVIRLHSRGAATPGLRPATFKARFADYGEATLPQRRDARRPLPAARQDASIAQISSGLGWRSERNGTRPRYPFLTAITGELAVFATAGFGGSLPPRWRALCS
jgi:hypothetical protein